MRSKSLRALVLAAALAAGSAGAAPTMWAGNGHFYEYIAAGGTFGAALAAADAAALPGYDGYLATLTSDEENSFVAGLVSAARGGSLTQTWVGGSDAAEEGVWRWIAGPEAGTIFWNGAEVPGQYHNWFRPQEPNDNGNEDGLSAFYFGNLLWNDLSTGDGSGYVIEYSLAPPTPGGGVPEPATWAILILGFAAAGASLRSRRRIAAATSAS